MMATPDNQVVMKMELTDEAKALLQAAQNAVQAAAQAAAGQTPGAPPPGMSSAMMRRYGLIRSNPPPGGGAQPATPRPVALPVDYNGQGTWSHDDSSYKLTVKDDKGRDHPGRAVAEDDRLVVTSQGHSLVFVR